MNVEELLCEISISDLMKLINEGLTAASQSETFPKYKSDEEIVLSASTVKELEKTLASRYSGENVKIFVDNSTVRFQLENDEFQIDRLGITFPKYERVLNDTVHTSMKINSRELITLLDKINIIAALNKPAHVMVMTLNPKNNEATISARHSDYGAVYETFNAEIKHNYLQVGFNINYSLDGLKAAGNNSIVIEFSGESEQARIMRENDNSFLYLLMPVRLIAADILNKNEK